MKKIILFMAFLVSSQVCAYRIMVNNQLDGNLVVNITEGKVTTPYTVRPQEYFKHDTAGCYELVIAVKSGRAIGQGGGIGNVFQKACQDYSVIARFLQDPSWDPITGKTDLVPKILELREQ